MGSIIITILWSQISYGARVKHICTIVCYRLEVIGKMYRVTIGGGTPAKEVPSQSLLEIGKDVDSCIYYYSGCLPVLP